MGDYGKILLNEGLYSYDIPLKPPSDEKDIINHEFNKHGDQFWRTPNIPDVKRMSQSERIRFIERERQRWDEGVYVLINGELVYFTGMFYDFLTYMTFKGVKATFFLHQCEDFYFRDLVRRDKKCKGSLWIKPRRYSATMQEQCQATYEIQSNFENNVGLQSDTDEKTKSTLLTPIIQSYTRRPKFMRSDYYKPNGKMLVSRLVLNSNLAPDENGFTKGDYLNGWCRSFPAEPRAMDGEQIAYGVMDECWKWRTASPKETYESNKLVLSGFGRSGKISALSTMGDSEQYIRSVMDGCDMIAKSNPNIRDENGYTITGLYKRFVSAVYSFDIPPEEYEYDKFGKVNVDKHREYILREINKHPKDTTQYIFAKRRLPLTESDAVLSASLMNYFSKIRTAQRRQQLLELPYDRQPFIKGMFDTSFSGKVGFDADENGIWKVAIHPYWSASKNIDTRNRFEIKRGVYYPSRSPEFFASLDPVRYEKEDLISNHFSRFCGMIAKLHDYYDSGVSNQYAGILLYRPDDPREGNREMIKACKYFGAPCLFERNITSPKEDFRDANMMPFLVSDPKDLKHGMLMKGNRRNTQDGVDMLRTRFAQPRFEDELDQIMLIPFDEMLLDMDNFDIANTTAFDVMMAMILLEHCMKQYPFSNISDNSGNNILETMAHLFPERS